MAFEKTLTAQGWRIEPSDTVKDSVILVSAAKLAAPDSDMLANVTDTFALNVAPYTRYRSTGSALVDAGGGGSAPPSVSGPMTNTVYTAGQITSYTMLGVVHTLTYSTINGTSVPASDVGGGVTRTFHWKNTTPPLFDYES